MDIPAILAVIAALLGSGGVVFGALRFNREEAARIVNIQTELMKDMRAVYEITRDERDQLLADVVSLRKDHDQLLADNADLRRRMHALKEGRG